MSLTPAGPHALSLQTREMPLGPVSASDRTIEVVWTTGATVRRHRVFGSSTVVPYDEVLLVSEAAVDLSRLRAGAPVLDSHITHSIESQRAVVDHAWLSGGKGYARLLFPPKGIDPLSDRLFDLARAKIIRNISVGYAINRIQVVEAKQVGEIERRIVSRWTPYELSFVTVPADAGAQTRNPTSAVNTRARLEALARMRAKAKARGFKISTQ